MAIPFKFELQHYNILYCLDKCIKLFQCKFYYIIILIEAGSLILLQLSFSVMKGAGIQYYTSSSEDEKTPDKTSRDIQQVG